MTESRTQPNVLFIITDQHRADHVGFMGNNVVRTPNLDAVAARGTGLGPLRRSRESSPMREKISS